MSPNTSENPDGTPAYTRTAYKEDLNAAKYNNSTIPSVGKDFLKSKTADYLSGGVTSNVLNGSNSDRLDYITTGGLSGTPAARFNPLVNASGALTHGSLQDRALNVVTGGLYGVGKSIGSALGFGGSGHSNAPVLVDPSTTIGERVYTQRSNQGPASVSGALLTRVPISATGY